ncbi:hypothetical protein, partial [Pseudomonas aeruginosa]|uniref:hypothetical protein n=1 Tax=Pseudomonas aeruginosa TaxID=287 RepID=UPI0032E8E3FE
VPAYGPQNDVTLKMPAFEWVHVQLHQQKGMISLSPPTICNSAHFIQLQAAGWPIWQIHRMGAVVDPSIQSATGKGVGHLAVTIKQTDEASTVTITLPGQNVVHMLAAFAYPFSIELVKGAVSCVDHRSSPVLTVAGARAS